MSSQQPAEIRASDAEREQTGELLREATVEGRLTLDEFSERYELAQRARTRGQLDAIARDLPQTSPAMRQRSASKLSALLSGIERTGSWQLAPTTKISCVFGGCKLNLRNATISAGVTTLDVSIFCGNLELIVPEGVDIEVEATMILSGRSERLSGSSVSSTLKPLIRITGFVICGSITVRDTHKFGERLREVATAVLNPPRGDGQR
jgi:hypothetical protein